jgi:CRISPR-associated protein Cas5t
VLDFHEHPAVEGLIRRALDGSDPRPAREYGLPFLGDNAFLIDKIEVREGPVRAHWYRRVGSEAETGAIPRSTRLTTWVDRQDMSKTRYDLFAPGDDPEEDDAANPDWAAWTAIAPPPKPTTKAPGRKG